MINTIPGGEFEHADDSTMHGNPGFSRTPFEAPSPTPRGGVGGCIHIVIKSPRGNEALGLNDNIAHRITTPVVIENNHKEERKRINHIKNNSASIYTHFTLRSIPHYPDGRQYIKNVKDKLYFKNN